MSKNSGAVAGKTGQTGVLPGFSQEKYQLVFLTYTYLLLLLLYKNL